MRKYVINLKNKNRNTLTDDLLLDHVKHLKGLRKSGVLFLCGPFNDDDGALQILIASSMEEAITYIENDPFIKYKYYQEYDIFELIEANEDNNYLIEDTQTKGNLL